VIAQAQEAEAAGYDSVFVMDHFYQLPGLGTPDQPMLEAYTALGGLATATERVQLGTLCHRQHLPEPDAAGQGHHDAGRDEPGSLHPRYRPPDGSSWSTSSWAMNSARSPTRFNKLDEALQIILPMIKGETPNVLREVLPHRGSDGQSPLSATTSR